MKAKWLEAFETGSAFLDPELCPALAEVPAPEQRDPAEEARAREEAALVAELAALRDQRAAFAAEVRSTGPGLCCRAIGEVLYWVV